MESEDESNKLADERIVATMVIDDVTLVQLPMTLLKTLNKAGSVSKKLIAKESGVSYEHVHGIMNLRSQKTAKISLKDTRLILDFGRRFAQSCENMELRKIVQQQCNDISMAIHSFLNIGALSSTEHAFVSHLNLDREQQRLFSVAHAGVYALVRRDKDGHIIISRMDILPIREGGMLCRFTSDTPASNGMDDPAVAGYIYAAGEHFFTVGHNNDTGALRSSILCRWKLPGSVGDADMLGLRLGASRRDGGPFAHRIYARWIADVSSAGNDLPDWNSTFRARTYGSDAIESIAERIEDIRLILRLLEENENVQRWGIGFPPGASL